MNIKVCGVTTMKQLQQLDALEVDFAGLVFYRNSPRYVADKISGDELSSADLDIKKTGVFMNQDFDEIMQAVETYGLDVVQLHGDETPHLCEMVSAEVETIKTFRVDHKSDELIDYILKDYDEVCDYYLFDTDSKPGMGAVQNRDNWKQIAESKIEKPFFLSGNIGPDEATLIRKFRHPDFYAVDINGMFEKSPGVKDMAMVLKFIHNLK